MKTKIDWDEQIEEGAKSGLLSELYNKEGNDASVPLEDFLAELEKEDLSKQVDA